MRECEGGDGGGEMNVTSCRNNNVTGLGGVLVNNER